MVDREGWKSIVVNKLMYGCGALAWYKYECDDLEIRQNGMGRWLWDVNLLVLYVTICTGSGHGLCR